MIRPATKQSRKTGKTPPPPLKKTAAKKKTKKGPENRNKKASPIQMKPERSAAPQAEIAQQRYRDLVEGLNSTVVWKMGAESFQVTFVSRRAEALLGYPLEEWYTDLIFWRDRLHPEDREKVLGCSISLWNGRNQRHRRWHPRKRPLADLRAVLSREKTAGGRLGNRPRPLHREEIRRIPEGVDHGDQPSGSRFRLRRRPAV